jgi:S-adenosylmethionine uptake transporter
MTSSTAPETKTSQVSIGVFWMIACLASFIGMAVASRELSETLSVFQILFFRSLVGLVVILIFARSILPELRRVQRFNLHLARNAVHFGAQYCWTLGVVLLPLAEVFALEFTMPVWVALFAYLFLGERISRPRLVAVVVSFLGILVILRPGVTIINPASFIVLLAAMGYGLSIIMVKRLTRECSPTIIVVWMILLQLPMGLALAVLDWNTPFLANMPWIILAGITGLSAHYAMAQALRLLDASIAIPIDFFRVPLIALIGFYFYGEAIELWLLIGAVMIFGSNYYALRKEAQGLGKRSLV